MRLGIRFQTKLVLTLVLSVVGVTAALILATEMKIRQTYVDQFSTKFQSLREGLEMSRKNRSEEFMALCRDLAANEHIIGLLKKSDDAQTQQSFWIQYVAGLRIIDPPRSNGGNSQQSNSKGTTKFSPDLIGKLGSVAVMNLEGEVTAIENPRFGEGPRKGKLRRPNTPQEQTKISLRKFAESEFQQTIFLPMEYQNRKTALQEMVSTPVVDPDTGDIIGQFLRASASETEAERSLERYQEEFGIHDKIKSGIYLGGEVYSRSLDSEFNDELSQSVREFLAGEPNFESPFESNLASESYAIYVDPIPGTSSLEPAYQVAAFPISQLREDLKDFRLRGSGIGAGVLLIAISLAFLLARNLAGPINGLSRGTQAIRSGDLDHRVQVKSKDELGQLAESFNEMAEELKQKAIYRELLGKVSDETVAQALVSGSLDLELGGELRDVSVLFCDIRNFTHQTEDMHPGDVITMLNEHMTSMTELVRKHKGVVDKFVGDEVMAVFGGLKSYGNDALNAASCALEMVQRREELNASAKFPIEIGIGIATGEVVAGCMGSVDRLNYTVLGARVNLAARLCGIAGSMEVFTDDETIHRISPAPLAETLSDVELRGFSKSIEAFRLQSLSVAADELEIPATS
ncbi:MAG: adenylate/guanylate cyclase domain-containing protein [Verrucomicrobiota bacterium]